MKYLIKITMILFILLFIFGNMNFVKAWEPIEGPGDRGSGSGSITQDINIEDYEPKNVEDEDGVFKERVGVILGVMRTIGIVVSVIALMVIGLRSMIGSVDEKSAYKESLPGYIIGVILVVAITVIPSIIYNFASEL